LGTASLAVSYSTIATLSFIDALGMLSLRARCTSVLIVDLDSLLNQYLARNDLCFTGMYLLLILGSLLPYKSVLINTSQSISGTQRSLLYRISSEEESQRGLDPPVSESAIFALSERASNDDSFAVALENDPLPPDADASGAEGLPLVPPGSISPATSSPPAGVLQIAASSENDKHASALPSPSVQQPPTSGDGVYDPEQPGLEPNGGTSPGVLEVRLLGSVLPDGRRGITWSIWFRPNLNSSSLNLDGAGLRVTIGGELNFNRGFHI
jgi:hypothetical protein